MKFKKLIECFEEWLSLQEEMDTPSRELLEDAFFAGYEKAKSIKKDHDDSQLRMSNTIREAYKSIIDEGDVKSFAKEKLIFNKDFQEFTLLKDVYKCYCDFYNVQLDENGNPIDSNELSQDSFEMYLRCIPKFKVKKMKLNEGLFKVANVTIR